MKTYYCPRGCNVLDTHERRELNGIAAMERVIEQEEIARIETEVAEFEREMRWHREDAMVKGIFIGAAGMLIL